MSGSSIGRARQAVAGLAIALAVAGCASTSATPMTIYVTLPPGATPTVEPTDEPTAVITEEPSPSESASTTEEPSPSESPSAEPSPTSPAAGCTGSDAHKAYFVNAAKDLPWGVYCAALPSSFWLEGSEYNRSVNRLYATYTNNAGAHVALTEGKLCDDLPTCADPFPVIGPASFGGLAATMRNMGGTMRCVVASPKSIPGYALCGDVGEAKIAQYAAAVVKVPKP
jgi:hypothetical protein